MTEHTMGWTVSLHEHAWWYHAHWNGRVIKGTEPTWSEAVREAKARYALLEADSPRPKELAS